MTTDSGFRNLRRAAEAACFALVLTGGGAGADEVPLVDGTHQTKSGDDVKKAYLIGLANVVQVEAAYQPGGQRRLHRAIEQRALGMATAVDGTAR